MEVVKMGHNNYSNFFKNEETGEVSELNNGGSEVVETVEENNEIVNEEIAETVKVTGVVSGCKKLYVRKEAKKESKPLCILDEGAEVVIDMEVFTTEDFYKICTSAGVEGYCMKKFINIK